MAVDLNHMIISSRDGAAGATWLADVLCLDEPERYGPFWQLTTGNGVNLDFHDGGDAGDEFTPQHYAFLITEDEFDTIFARIVERGIDYYADPMAQRKGEINHHDGGRGTYFFSPDGHWMEIITRPYGSGS